MALNPEQTTLTTLLNEMETMRAELASQKAELHQLKALNSATPIASPFSSQPTSRRHMLKRLAVTAAGAAVIGTAISVNGFETAQAQAPVSDQTVGDGPDPVTPFAPPPPTVAGTFYKTIAGIDFIPETSTTPYDKGTFFGSINKTAASGDNVEAYLDLPQGAVITEIVWYFTKPIAGDFTLTLSRFDTPNQTAISLFNDTTNAIAVGATVQTIIAAPAGSITLAQRTVDNTAFNYTLQVTLPFNAGGTHYLQGARVGYTLPFGSATYFLSSPIRVAASTNSGGTLSLLTSSGNPANPDTTSQIVQITGVVVNALSVPAGAKAILASVTSVGATTAGNLRLWPDGGTTPTVNSLNIPLNSGSGTGFNLTTSVIVSLSSAGKLKIAYNNSTASSTCGFSIDVVGYIF